MHSLCWTEHNSIPLFLLFYLTHWHIFILQLLALLSLNKWIFAPLPFHILHFSMLRLVCPFCQSQSHTCYCRSCDITHVSYLPSNACTNTRSEHQLAFLLLSFSLFFLSSSHVLSSTFLYSFSVSLHRPPPPWLSTACTSQLDCSLTGTTFPPTFYQLLLHNSNHTPHRCPLHTLPPFFSQH